jgi:hypothetical protein
MRGPITFAGPNRSASAAIGTVDRTDVTACRAFSSFSGSDRVHG